ncbi:MAG: alpha-amylase family glycosyl hydrolase [Bifidobacterium pseudocatenulatum]
MRATPAAFMATTSIIPTVGGAHCHLLGLWDLNTANPEVANRMHDFLKTAVNDGVDGFRFDAGKHVELPNEFDGSQYWTTILQNGSQYQYGEVLQGDSGLDYKAYANLYAKYGEGGGGATASDYGKTIRSALWSKNLNAGNLMSLRNGGVNDDQLVTWVESHDNYANGDKESTYLTNDQIRFGWAVVGARAGGAPLFPSEFPARQPQFAEASQLGDASDDMWKTRLLRPSTISAMLDGEAAYLRNCGSEQNNNSTSRNVTRPTTIMTAWHRQHGRRPVWPALTSDDSTYADRVAAPSPFGGGSLRRRQMQ